jgi:8-oxo-dGTP pyrophosphatase MutT (NUDIX family)
MNCSTNASGTSARLLELLDQYAPATDQEAADVERIRRLASTGDAWSRSSAVHVTGSAIILHPDSGRVLLRWHARMQGWLQVGGHADPAETDPFQIALREAVEETGLDDLVAWPAAGRPSVVQIVVVEVPAGRGEPAHEHADVRYLLATGRPDAARPEHPDALLRWLSLDQARALVGEDNLRDCLDRVARALESRT